MSDKTKEQEESIPSSSVKRSKRTRTGCLTCRKRHRKCDEIRKTDPDDNSIKCLTCKTNGFECDWPEFIIWNGNGGCKTVSQEREEYTVRHSKTNKAKRSSSDVSSEDSCHKDSETSSETTTTSTTSAKTTTTTATATRTSTTGSTNTLLASTSTTETPNLLKSPPMLRMSNSISNLLTCDFPTPQERKSEQTPSSSTATEQQNQQNQQSDNENNQNQHQNQHQHQQQQQLQNNNEFSNFFQLPNSPITIDNFTIPKEPDLESFISLTDKLREFMYVNAITSSTDLDPSSTTTTTTGTGATTTTTAANDANTAATLGVEDIFIMNNQKGLLLPITSSTSNSNLLNTGEGGGEGGSTTQHLLPKEEVIRSYFVNVENFNNNQQYEPPPINLSSENELFILLNYVQVVGTGLDMFDINKCMVKVIPSKIKQVPALKYAIYALTSRYLETKVENYPNDLTIQLYHSALSHLLPSYNNRDKGVLVVTTCIILCVLEMMSSDPKNWSVYLSGCVLLLKSYKIDGFSKDDLERAIFWVFIRMDICYCVINECQGILGSEYYFDHERFKKIELVDEIFSKYDMWANYIVYLNSLIMNLIYSNKEGEIFKKEWLELWDRLSKWYFNEVEMELFRPVHEYFDEKIQFPRIFYSNSQAISANQMYHMGVIFMIQNKPRSVKLSGNGNGNGNGNGGNRQQSSSLTYHAKQIVGIGITNNDYGGYCNSVQPLYVAGLILTSKKEHGVLLSALRKVEECTGWSTYWRCRDLMNYWCGC